MDRSTARPVFAAVAAIETLERLLFGAGAAGVGTGPALGAAIETVARGGAVAVKGTLIAAISL
jgi:hypothetical protein